MRHAATIAVFAVLAGLFAFAANDWRVPWRKAPARGPEWCAAHEKPLAECERCNPALARGGTFVTREREPEKDECPNLVLRVNLAPGAAERAGFDYHVVRKATADERIRANAETRFPPDKYARVAPRVAGIIRDVKDIKVTLGQEVTRGQVLAVLESADVGRAKADYLQALAVLDIRRQVYESEKTLARITSGRDLLAAEVAFKEAALVVKRAEQTLSSLGLSAARVAFNEIVLVLKRAEQALTALGFRAVLIAAPAEPSASPLMDVVAPFDGTVVSASAVPGESAGPDKPLFAVADMARMWLSVDVYEGDLARVRRDQRVSFTVDGLPGRRFPGRVAAVGAEVDDRTRTARVYADIKNVDGLLRGNMFGRVEIRVEDPEPRLLVPKSALQSDGECAIVFVSLTRGRTVFKPHRLELGAAYEHAYEVRRGLAEGDEVVTTGSFLLKTEILRGQMGAG
ncbi:MAG: efflux RND transporter periplasmic adaptor subunit [Planctomycetes bacterium]|nr:efflux RND transporter periplasmic adaptor subunit [Planctomycetota bacterium]